MVEKMLTRLTVDNQLSKDGVTTKISKCLHILLATSRHAEWKRLDHVNTLLTSLHWCRRALYCDEL